MELFCGVIAAFLIMPLMDSWYKVTHTVKGKRWKKIFVSEQSEGEWQLVDE